ncbi:hypothetical protein BKA62DRAFT_780011 [Auriculariales sp. MPI-PUGE-AT-0066]|nr:hypothetical protein BKA62DRAFT_780011 [Auriculariales sp. MPI-PUGE-AT-0066]
MRSPSPEEEIPPDQASTLCATTTAAASSALALDLFPAAEARPKRHISLVTTSSLICKRVGLRCLASFRIARTARHKHATPHKAKPPKVKTAPATARAATRSAKARCKQPTPAPAPEPSAEDARNPAAGRRSSRLEMLSKTHTSPMISPKAAPAPKLRKSSLLPPVSVFGFMICSLVLSLRLSMFKFPAYALSLSLSLSS